MNIEEYIKIVENYLANSAINEIDSNFFKNGGWETVDLEIPKSMQHILSDYKRVLKENKTLNERNQYLVKYRAKLEKELYESNENYIPVSLVEEKIEELENQMEKDKVDDFGIHSIGWSILDYIVECLKSLLQEGDDK